MGSRLFRSTLSIALLCMLVPLLALGITSGALTNRASTESFHNERTQQLTLLCKTCDLLLDECSFIYYQTLLGDEAQRALGNGLTRPMPYEQLRYLQSFYHSLDLIACSRPNMHSILLYEENPLGLTISSRYGLVRIATDPDKGWYDAFAVNRDKRSFAVARDIYGVGKVLTFCMPTARVLRREGVMVFNYTLAGLEALLPADGTQWFVLDGDGAPLFSTRGAEPMSDALVAEILSMSQGAFVYPESAPSKVLYQVQSDAYGWRFVNVADRAMISRSSSYVIRTMVFVTIAALLLSVMITIWLTRLAVRQEMTKRQLRLREAEMLALQAQINPHFLYNTLELVNWRAIKAMGEDNGISNIVTTLSDLLRYALERPGEPVPLERELEHARRYAELMALRLGAIFTVDWRVDGAARGVPVPKLILQPLIENAIQHGVQPKGENGVVTVAISLSTDVRLLRITISDNGAGMSNETLDALRTQLETFDGLQYAHIGLFNVYQRIRLAFTDMASMTIQSALDIGTRIDIEIPAQQQKGEDAHANVP